MWAQSCAAIALLVAQRANGYAACMGAIGTKRMVDLRMLAC
jgi:hypothetical protein